VAADVVADATQRRRLDEMLDRARTLATDGRFDESIAALLQAEQEHVASSHGTSDAAFLADLWVLRGMAQYRRGYGGSAVLDLDAGVSSHGDLAASGDRDAQLALAKALALNASVLQLFGDPELAAGSADAAIRLFLQHTDRLDDGPPEATNSHHLCLAARVSGDVHAVSGRLEIALQADDIAVRTADRLADSDRPDDERLLVEAMTRKALRLRDAGRMDEARPLFRSALDADYDAAQAVSEQLAADPPLTLAQALASATERLGRPPSYDDLIALTTPAPHATLATTSGRCDLEAAPVRARELAGLARPMLGADPEAGLRLGLEAHYLFALGSRNGAQAMRFRLGEFGPVWADLLIDLSRAFEAAGESALAMDMAAWGGGLANSLLPFTVSDEGLRSLVADCIERHGALLAAAGESDRARDAFTAARDLRG
jgi:tetratricopeptide (TPR) repeat protein